MDNKEMVGMYEKIQIKQMVGWIGKQYEKNGWMVGWTGKKI